jgi:hypothetical protein
MQHHLMADERKRESDTLEMETGSLNFGRLLHEAYKR